MNFLDPCPLDKWSPARKSTCLDYWMGHLASPGRLWWQKNCKLSTFSFSLLLVISIKLLLPYCAFFWPGCFLVWKPLLIAISVLLFGYCPMSFNLLYYIIWWSHPSVTTVLRICTLNLNFKMLIKRLGLIVNSVSIWSENMKLQERCLVTESRIYRTPLKNDWRPVYITSNSSSKNSNQF